MANAQTTQAGIIAPPPVLYLATLGAGLCIQAFSPQPIFHSVSLSMWLGIAFLILSSAFARWSFVVMRQASTTASPREVSTALVVDGPFRFSRNPIYVAMTGLYLGISFLANAAWPLGLLGPLLLVMHFWVVLREERYLAGQFGQPYRVYQSSVRRWL